mgnify:CR=1 FL=1
MRAKRTKHQSKDKTPQQPAEPKKRGRRATGRRRAQLYITAEEEEQLRQYLQDIRQGHTPVPYSRVKETADREYEAAIQREAKNANKPMRTGSYYKAEALYSLIGLPCQQQPFKKQVRQRKEQLEREKHTTGKQWSREDWEQWKEGNKDFLL